MTAGTLLIAIIVHWAVSPMGDEMLLPDHAPRYGTSNGVVRITAARGEYEPGSFVVVADRDLGKQSVRLSEFVRADGVRLPSGSLDLKFVKVWYQNKNGWFTYFGDVGGSKLVPELLVNDEELIRVDTNAQRNYARLVDAQGNRSEYWLNPPYGTDQRKVTVNGYTRTFENFRCMRPDFRDAETLQPVHFGAGEYKQFLLTVKTADDTPSGTYRGTVMIGTAGQVPVEITVLDFTLPAPKALNDPEQDFWVAFYSYISLDFIKTLNGGDAELAKRQLERVFADQAAHGQQFHWFRFGLGNGSNAIDSPEGREELKYTVAAMAKAGMRTKPLIGWFFEPELTRGDEAATRRSAARRAAEMDALVGHHDIYLGYGDEPSIAATLNDHRPMEKLWQEEGFKFILASAPQAFFKNAQFLDWHNINAEAIRDELPRRWNVVGGGKRIAWYSAQHVGAEDPALSRRQNGLAAWLSGYNALCNYAHHFSPYNDDKPTYRPMVYAYGAGNGVIDTLAWEGFREGIDDIRYGTLLLRLARSAVRQPDLRRRRIGVKALAYLAQLDKARCDLDEVRTEMINFILLLK